MQALQDYPGGIDRACRPWAAACSSITARSLAMLSFLAFAATASGQSTLPTPTADFEVREWVIFVADANQKGLNQPGLFKSTLPDFVPTRRPAAGADDVSHAMPIGLIRVVAGPEMGETRFDVQVGLSGGELLAHWPRGKVRSASLLWTDLAAASESAGLQRLPTGHWLSALRAGDFAFVGKDGASERFLLYDAAIPYSAALQVTVEEGGYGLANTGPAPMHDLQLYKQREGAWHVANIASLAVATSPPATQPAATRPATASNARPARSLLSRILPAIIPGVARPDQPAAQPAPEAPAPPPPPVKPSIVVSLAAASGNEPADLLVSWKSKVADAGLDQDLDVILSILSEHALDPRRLTAIYRMDPGELERLLPLSIVPQPRKTTRVGLVILRGVDPAIVEEIEELIAQLGHDEWSKREAASKQLAELGPAARDKLQQALKSGDLEIVYRAERLLQALEKKS